MAGKRLQHLRGLALIEQLTKAGAEGFGRKFLTNGRTIRCQENKGVFLVSALAGLALANSACGAMAVCPSSKHLGQSRA